MPMINMTPGAEYVNVKMLNMDCMEFMKTCKDKRFELAIVDPETLHELTEWQENQICCIAAHCGSVRLIDNLLF